MWNAMPPTICLPLKVIEASSKFYEICPKTDLHLGYTLYARYRDPSSSGYTDTAVTRSFNWTPSSEFVSSSIPSWQILTVHGQSFRGAGDLAFCLKGLLDSLLVWASSGGSGETAQMRRLAWTFAARIGDKYQICLTRPIKCLSLKTGIIQSNVSFEKLIMSSTPWIQSVCLISWS